MSDIDGIYSGYFSGAGGNGLALFVFRDGVIAGADAFGVVFDGHYERSQDQILAGQVTVTAPPNGTLVQGVSTGPSGITYTVDISFPENFAEVPYLGVTTPLGPVNVKLVRLRAL